MKKSIQWLMVLMAVLTMFLVPGKVKAFDESLPEVNYQKEIGILVDEPVIATSVKMGAKVKNAKKITVSSSKKNIVDAWMTTDNKDVVLSANKVGKAVVTVKVNYKNGKTSSYPINVTVYKYTNPVKKFKIGNKSFSFKKKWSWQWTPDSGYYDDVIKAKLSITPNSGWKLRKIYTHGGKAVKNNSTVKIDGKKYTYYLAVLYNSKKKLIETVNVDVESWVDDPAE